MLYQCGKPSIEPLMNTFIALPYIIKHLIKSIPRLLIMPVTVWLWASIRLKNLPPSPVMDWNACCI
jgi:hypothetical protein